jgi:hypothetical protein
MRFSKQPFGGVTTVLAAGITASFLACGGQDSEVQPQSEESVPPTAQIVQPTEGVTLDGPDVLVRLAVQGISLAPAGMDSANTGHLHLFVNQQLTPEGEVIPAGEGTIHLGLAQSEHLLTGLEPGEYLVIAVLGDYLHTRIPGSRTDTVRFTVR